MHMNPYTYAYMHTHLNVCIVYMIIAYITNSNRASLTWHLKKIQGNEFKGTDTILYSKGQ